MHKKKTALIFIETRDRILKKNNQNKFAFYLLLSNFLFVIVLLLGPYNYKIYSYKALLYYIFCVALFYIGLHLKFKKSKTKLCSYTITQKGEIIIVIFCLLVCIATVYTFYYSIIANSNIQDYQFAAEDYRMLTPDRTMLSRFMEMFMHFAAPIYIIYNHSTNRKKRLSKITVICYWAPPVYYLALGARWSLFFYILVFYLNYKLLHKNVSLVRKLFEIKFRPKIKKIIIFFLLIYIGVLIYNLFENRGIYDASELFMVIPGDVKLKNWAEVMLKWSNGALDPIYKFFYYCNHSIFVFAYMFKNYVNVRCTFGLFQFSIIQYLFMLLGFSTNFVKEVLASVPGYGSYMTFLHGFIIDWGYWLTPPMVFLNGILFCNLESRKDNSIIMNWIYPFIGPMILISPIYGMWTVAMVNVDIFFLTLLYFILIKKIDVRMR